MRKRREWAGDQVLEHHVLAQCDACGGTGLYKGLAERGTSAVVCAHCSGAGCQTISFLPWRGRQEPKGEITRVFGQTGGFVVDETIEGGVSLEEWQDDPLSPFALGNEIRDLTCPLLWYYFGVSDRWPECVRLGERILDCSNYPQKDQCWEKYDREQTGFKEEYRERVRSLGQWIGQI